LVVSATWDDAPHLDEATKAQLWNSIPAYQRDARTKGIPQLGSGAIYPFPESQFKVAIADEFEPPKHWPRAFGGDCALSGVTAAAWGALDRDSDTLYVYSVYRRSQAETAVHADAIKARGVWIPGVMDAADVLDHDRTQFITLYKRHGLDVMLPDKAVEAGIQDVYDRISAGRLKVFASCVAFWDEFRLYQRDERGRVVKKNDHVLDAVRYLVRTGLRHAKVKPEPKEEVTHLEYEQGRANLTWMQ